LNWKFYLIQLGIVLLAVAAVNFFSAYFKGRGASLATKADFDELLSQLRATTETTESIRRTISHEDWSIREFKMLRRSKLEELMLALYDTHHWLEKKGNASLYAEPGNQSADPINRVKVIAGLYFPELNAEILEFRKAYLAYQSWANDAKAKLGPLRLTDVDKYVIELPLVVANYSRVYEPFLFATTAAEQKASVLMKEVIGVDF
jgi:hypothetical protein